uniref:Peptidase M14 domain-containing protein n=1 Tax=Timema genevievae TaxID=629358 RepID=A0A7R9PRA5_TIMGE|nr:unnamed protein product [Timema genevievae]
MQTGTLTCTGMVGASSDPCDDTFSGTKGFSEAESQALQKYALKYQNRIKMYLTLHCYGNHDLAVKASEAHVKAGGEEYTIGSSTNVLWEIDHIKKKTITELLPNSSHAVPSEMILSVVRIWSQPRISGDRKWKEGRRTTMLPSDDGISDPAAGGSDDWMKEVVGVDYSYTIEMTQEYGGFILNPVLINKTVVRFFEAIRVFGQFVADMEPN